VLRYDDVAWKIGDCSSNADAVGIDNTLVKFLNLLIQKYFKQ